MKQIKDGYWQEIWVNLTVADIQTNSLSSWKATESVSIWGSWTLWILIHPVWRGVIIMIHCKLEERHNTQSLIYKLNLYFQYLHQSSFPTLNDQKYPDSTRTNPEITRYPYKWSLKRTPFYNGIFNSCKLTLAIMYTHLISLMAKWLLAWW